MWLRTIGDSQRRCLRRRERCGGEVETPSLCGYRARRRLWAGVDRVLVRVIMPIYLWELCLYSKRAQAYAPSKRKAWRLAGSALTEVIQSARTADVSTLKGRVSTPAVEVRFPSSPRRSGLSGSTTEPPTHSRTRPHHSAESKSVSTTARF